MSGVEEAKAITPIKPHTLHFCPIFMRVSTTHRCGKHHTRRKGGQRFCLSLPFCGRSRRKGDDPRLLWFRQHRTRGPQAGGTVKNSISH